jgi:serine O-acetyltransferase
MNKKIPTIADKDFLDNLVEKITLTYEDECGINHIEGFNLPSKKEIINILNELLEIIFPGFSGKKSYNLSTIKYNIGELLANIYAQLSDQIERSLRYNCSMNNCKACNVNKDAEEAVRKLLKKIPEIRESMKLDVQAAYDGDPAALSLDEIVLSYPGIKAITVQRIAHALYENKVPLIPRMMSESLHSETGIDIHPGAKLGKGVFVDHGTGVVIGETAILGDYVKIYQGVTLGALSFPKDACGVIIKGAKRHPTIGNNVTIYSGATILGDIVIGDNSIIGGNVWLTESTDPGTKITIEAPKNLIKKR